jgi:hypothetical protein
LGVDKKSGKEEKKTEKTVANGFHMQGV